MPFSAVPCHDGRTGRCSSSDGWTGAPAYTLPLPLSFTGCGSCSALSMIVRVALYGFPAFGLNVTPIVHFAAGASGASQPFVALYGLTAPLDPSINTVRPGFFLLPLGLLTVMFFGPLDEPTVTVPKFSDAGLIFSLTSTGVGVAVGVAAAVRSE